MSIRTTQDLADFMATGGLSQIDLVRALGVSPPTISKALSGGTWRRGIPEHLHAALDKLEARGKDEPGAGLGLPDAVGTEVETSPAADPDAAPTCHGTCDALPLAHEPDRQEGSAPPKDDGEDDEPPAFPDFMAAVVELAALPGHEFHRVKKERAKLLGVPVGYLVDAVAAHQRIGGNGDSPSSAAVEELEPWGGPVDGLELLQSIRADLDRYVVMDKHLKDTVALWTFSSFSYGAFNVWPRLFYESPEKRCGKSRSLEVTEANTPRPLMASNLSPATVYRAIEKWKPTLLIDEADRLPKDNNGLIGILNSGHSRRHANVLRMVGPSEDMDPKVFSTWAPIVFAAIGRMETTIMDRAIVIAMRRKLPSERVARLPRDYFGQRRDYRRKCLRWAMDHEEALCNADPVVPACDNDRAVDNWLPLFAVADEVGGDWRERAERAFGKLNEVEEEESRGAMLLKDIRDVFASRSNPDALHTTELLRGLTDLEDRPWAEWNRGFPMTPGALARVLKPFRIRPDDIRRGGRVLKGYKLERLQDAFSRYIPPTGGGAPAATTLQPSNGAASGEIAIRYTAATEARHHPLHPLQPASGFPVAENCSGNGGECSGAVAATENNPLRSQPSNGAGCSVVADSGGGCEGGYMHTGAQVSVAAPCSICSPAEEAEILAHYGAEQGAELLAHRTTRAGVLNMLAIVRGQS